MLTGLDEAGRGPALGPMVLAGVTLRPEDLEELGRRGLKDSKAFGPPGKAIGPRRALALEIEARAVAFAYRLITPEEIDRRNLTWIERQAAAAILWEVKRDGPIYADGAGLFGALSSTFKGLTARDKADENFPIVAAASILAKSRRDAEWEKIRLRYEPEFGAIPGGGYGNPSTMKFLRAYVDRHGDLPPEARRKWKNVRALLEAARSAPAAGEPRRGDCLPAPFNE